VYYTDLRGRQVLDVLFLYHPNLYITPFIPPYKMGEARHNILVKSAQMQKMNHRFQGKQMLDTVNIFHFSESIEYDYFQLMRK
jgi:hypothetical protein